MDSTQPASSRPSGVKAHALEGSLLIAASAFCYGASAVLGKSVFNGAAWLRDSHIDPLILSQTRTSFSVCVLLPVLLLWQGTKAFRAERETLFQCAAMGVLGVCGANFFYYYAIEKSTVAAAITVQYTAPVWVYLYEVIARVQRATLARSAVVVLAFAGCALVALGGPGTQVKASGIGIASALGAAFSYAFYNVIGAVLLKKTSRSAVLFYAMLAASLFWLLVNPPWKVVAQGYSPRAWLFLFGFAMTSMLLPLALYLGGLRLLDPTSAIVTSCLEPVFAAILAAMFVGESLNPWQVAGMALVVAVAVAITRLMQGG